MARRFGDRVVRPGTPEAKAQRRPRRLSHTDPNLPGLSAKLPKSAPSRRQAERGPAPSRPAPPPLPEVRTPKAHEIAAVGRLNAPPPNYTRAAARADTRLVKRYFADVERAIKSSSQIGQEAARLRPLREARAQIDREQAGGLRGAANALTAPRLTTYLGLRTGTPGGGLTQPHKTKLSAIDLALLPLTRRPVAGAGRLLEELGIGARRLPLVAREAAPLARAPGPAAALVGRRGLEAAVARAARVTPKGILKGTPKAVKRGILTAPFAAQVPTAVAHAAPGDIAAPLAGKGVAMEWGAGVLHPRSGANHLVQNAVHDILGAAATVVPGTAMLVGAIAQGFTRRDPHRWDAVATLWDELKKNDAFASQTEGIDLKKFWRLFTQHPVFTVLDATGAYGLGGRAHGALARRGTQTSRIRAANLNTRTPLEGPTPLPRDYSPNYWSQRLQVRYDRREHAAWAKQMAGKPLTHRERLLARTYEGRRQRALTFQRQFQAGRLDQNQMHAQTVVAAALVDIMKHLKVKSIREANRLVPLVMYAIERTMRPGTELADLAKLKAMYLAAREGLQDEASLLNNQSRIDAIDAALKNPALIERAQKAAKTFIETQRPHELALIERGIEANERMIRARQIPEAAVHGGFRRAERTNDEGAVVGQAWQRATGSYEQERPSRWNSPRDDEDIRNTPSEPGGGVITSDGRVYSNSYDHLESGEGSAAEALAHHEIAAEFSFGPEHKLEDFERHDPNLDQNTAEDALVRAGIDHTPLAAEWDAIFGLDNMTPEVKLAYHALQNFQKATHVTDRRNYPWHLEDARTPVNAHEVFEYHVNAARASGLAPEAWLNEAETLLNEVKLEAEANRTRVSPSLDERLNEHLDNFHTEASARRLAFADVVGDAGLPPVFNDIEAAAAAGPSHSDDMAGILRDARRPEVVAFTNNVPGIHEVPAGLVPGGDDAFFVWVADDGTVQGGTGVLLGYTDNHVQAFSMKVADEYTGQGVGKRLATAALAQYGLSPHYRDNFSIYGLNLAQKAMENVAKQVKELTGRQPEVMAPPGAETGPGIEVMPTEERGAGFLTHRPRTTASSVRSGLGPPQTDPFARTGEALLSGSSPADMEQLARSLLTPMIKNIRHADFQDVVATESIIEATTRKDAISRMNDPELRARHGEMRLIRIPDPDEATRHILDDLDAAEGVDLTDISDLANDAFQRAEDVGDEATPLPGKYTLVSDEGWQYHKQLRAVRNQQLVDATRAFKRAVLPWSPNWYLGNYIDTSLRALINGQLPAGLDRLSPTYKVGRRLQNISAERRDLSVPAPNLEGLPTGIRQGIEEGRIDPNSPEVYHLIRENARIQGGTIPGSRLGGEARRLANERANLPLLGDPSLAEAIAPGGQAGAIGASGSVGIRGAAKSAAGAVILRRLFQQNRTPARGVARAIAKFRHDPKAETALDAMSASNQFLINLNSGLLERTPLYTHLGKQAIREIRQQSGKMVTASNVTDQALRDWVEGHRGTETQALLAKRTQAAFGNWMALSPALRNGLLQLAPFALWFRAAFKFVYITMPRDHPILTAILTQAAEATEEQRRLLGLDLWGEAQIKSTEDFAGPLPGYLQGSLPLGGGRLARGATTVTSFGVFSDGWLSVGNFILPQFTSIQDAANAVDFKGQRLSHVGTGKALNPDQRGIALALALGETFLPGLALAHRTTLAIAAPGRTSGPLWWETYGHDKSRGQALLNVYLPPTRVTGDFSRRQAQYEQGFGRQIVVPIKGNPESPASKRSRKKRLNVGGVPSASGLGPGGASGSGLGP